MKFGKELKIGILAIIVLTATFVIINILRGKDLLGREITLSGRFDDVEFLVPSAPVQIRGYNAGRVISVEYDAKEDDFLVQCSIDKRFRIPSDSRMNIYSTSIMGGKGIRIELGSSGELAGDGDELETGSDLDLITSFTRDLNPLVLKVTSTLDSIQTLISGVNSVLSEQNREGIASSVKHLDKTLADVSRIASSVSDKRDGIQTIVDNLRTLSDKLVPLVDTVGSAVSGVNAFVGSLNEIDLDGTVDGANDAIGEINDAVREIRQPLNTLISDVDSLVGAIQANPRKYVKISLF